MTVETHAIIMTQGEDLLTELSKNLESGNLITKLTNDTFSRIDIQNVKYVRIADPHETDHHDRTSIWIEATITF
jgi:hypothetical protein